MHSNDEWFDVKNKNDSLKFYENARKLILRRGLRLTGDWICLDS